MFIPKTGVSFYCEQIDCVTNAGLSFFKPASFQEKSFIVSGESVCPDVCCRRSEDTGTGRKVTFIT